MPEGNINREFRLKKIIEKINQNKIVSKKYQKICSVLNYIDHSLIVISAMTGIITISAFAFLVGILIRITCSAIGLKICVIAAEIKKYKSVIKKKKNKYDKIVLLAKSKLNSIEGLIPQALIDSNISQD